MSYIIRVENLGKKYKIRHQQQERYVALRDVMARRVMGIGCSVFNGIRSWVPGSSASNGHQPISNGNGIRDFAPHASPLTPNGNNSSLPASTEDFWALKNVSFEVKQGEVVGIIGRNGAGKSTLLKILSQITEPTEGRVRIRGRVASLLEIGTGFHPELTGHENIFVNGAILGMTRDEVRRKFDEIVAFAEIEKFLDTPVKRYSSGMYVRLAFAVAAHLEPEILLVDEVLAVGDAGFQKKCLGKIGDVAKNGRTVLFVSHNMAAVQGLCRRALVFDCGRGLFDGNPAEAIIRYVGVADGEVENVTFSESISLTRLEITPPAVPRDGKTLIHLELQANQQELITDLALLIHAANGERAALIDLRSSAGPYRLKSGSRLVIRTDVINIPFVEGDFNVGLYINAHSICHSFMNLLTFTMLPAKEERGVPPREPQYRGLVDLCTDIEARVILNSV